MGSFDEDGHLSLWRSHCAISEASLGRNIALRESTPSGRTERDQVDSLGQSHNCEARWEWEQLAYLFIRVRDSSGQEVAIPITPDVVALGCS
jgi:hypothetical protein